MKRIYKFSGLIALVLILFVLSACKTEKYVPDSYADSIRPSITGTWKLVSMKESPVEYYVSNKITFIIPEDPPHSINGSTGINLYNGTAWIQSEDFTCGAIAVTKIAGTQEEEKNESEYLRLLKACNKIKYGKDGTQPVLCIYNKEKTIELNFIKLD